MIFNFVLVGNIVEINNNILCDILKPEMIFILLFNIPLYQSNATSLALAVLSKIDVLSIPDLAQNSVEVAQGNNAVTETQDPFNS
jgi:hypothetical protein